MTINNDGSIQGELFSGYDVAYPSPNFGKETYRQYRERVSQQVKIGFHLGDLNWRDYEIYCKGSGVYEGWDADSII